MASSLWSRQVGEVGEQDSNSAITSQIATHSIMDHVSGQHREVNWHADDILVHIRPMSAGVW